MTNLDIATPAIAVAAASIVNIIGDLALTTQYGIQGAAVATALATVTSCAILLRKVRKTTDEWKVKQEELERGTDTTTNDNDFTTKEVAATDEEKMLSLISAEATETRIESLERKHIEHERNIDATNSSNNNGDGSKRIPFCSIPDKISMINLFKVAGPIFFVMMAKVVCYNVLTIRATTFGIVSLASHNIMMRVFFFFACFGDSLSQAGQSFYPQVDEKVRGKLIKRLFCISAFVGVFNNQVSQLILTRLGRFFAQDTRIVETMAQHAPWVGFAVLLHPFIMFLEGTVLAKRDLFFMVGTYSLSTLLHLSLVFSPFASTFSGLWRSLFVFQAMRLTQFAFRVWYKSRAEAAGNISSSSNSSVGNAEQEMSPAPLL